VSPPVRRLRGRDVGFLRLGLDGGEETQDVRLLAALSAFLGDAKCARA
jgi:hypothetical protein